jgi:hypothetical protein
MWNYSGGPPAIARSGTNEKDESDVIYISEPGPEPEPELELELSLRRTDAANRPTVPNPSSSGPNATSTRTPSPASSRPDGGAGRQTKGSAEQTNSPSMRANGAGRQTNAAGKRGRGDVSLLRDPDDLRRQWESIRVRFVDSPRGAVGEAENLLSSTIGEIVTVFRSQRERLEVAWSQGKDASTDELGMAFQRYRDFFDRLLHV